MPFSANDPEAEGPEPSGPEPPSEPPFEQVDQDSFRRIYFGQLSDPLIPEPDSPSMTPEDELTRAALSDPAARDLGRVDPLPTTWRWVFLLFLAVVALGTVFWKR